MLKVSILECKTNGRVLVSRHRTKDEHDARNKAVRKYFGRLAFFHQDSGLPDGYGQVFQPASRNGSGFCANALTGRVRIDVE